MKSAVYIIGGGPLATSIPRWAREVGLVPVVTDKDRRAPGLHLADETLIADGAAVEAHVDFARGLADRYRVVGVYCGGEFGLETARPPEFDDLLKERKRILTKGKLTKRDKEKLEALNARMGDLPAGENLQDLEAMEIIRRAAQRIKKEHS